MKKNPASEPATIIPPTHEDISQRATSIWQSYGQPEGRDTEIWLEAERQLLGINPLVKTGGDTSMVAISFGETVTTSRKQPRAATPSKKFTGSRR
jgi:hypothetical protein